MDDPVKRNPPLLIVLTKELVPKEFTLFSLTNDKFKKIKLPLRMLDVSEERKKKIIIWCVRNYLLRFNGFCLFWGKVNGFYYFDSNIAYNVSEDGRELYKANLEENLIQKNLS